MSTASRTPVRLAVGGAVAALPLALALCACSSGTPTPAATMSSPPASAAQAAATAAGTGGASVTGSSVKVPKYVAADNARKNVVTTGCEQLGTRGWRLSGTATNTGSSDRTYTIVVDYVTPKGDTVVDTKVVRVGPVRPGATAHWSSTGAAGAGQVVCVIRQALAGS
jgi:hypothetical protein